VLHGHNPWLTTYLHYPQGVNLAENTSMPLLGLLGLPVTWAFGPIVTFNLFMWLAYPVSALACFVLLRRWVRWPVAAFVGGLLYGFSPFMVAQGLGHLNLLVVPFPPLVLLLLDDLLVRRRGRPLARGLLLGVVLAAEFLVSPELFASTILMALVGLLLLVLVRLRQVRDRLRRAWPGLLACGLLTGVLIVYPAWVEFAGPHAFHGPPQQLVFTADLLGTVVPTKLQLLAPAALTRLSARFAGGDPSEVGSYLGLPLLFVLAGFVLTHWRRGEVRLAAALFVAATVVSWGPHLEVAGHATGIPLPVDLVFHLPLFQDFVYDRFALYADLAAAWLLALAVDQAHSWWRTRRSRRLDSKVSRRRRWGSGALLLAGFGACLVLLVPAWPNPIYPVTVPPYATSSAVRQIPRGGVVLTYPYPSDLSPQPMLWQAAAGMRYRLMGAYALTRGQNGQASLNPLPPTQRAVPATLLADALGQPVSQFLAGGQPATPSAVRRFVRTYHVDAVLLQVGFGQNSGAAQALLTAALGRPRTEGGLEVWILSGR
jgi:hypothetical protein